MTDVEKPGSIDMEQALLDPESVFDSPEVLVSSEALSLQQKIELLRRWEYDESENDVALEEGMPDGESDLLRRILLALDQLTGGIDPEQTGPTKQHGIPPSATRRK